MDLVVYGASGFGQQVMFWVEDAAAEESWNVLGFLDDDTDALGSERGGHEVLGGRQWLEARAGPPLGVVVAIADPAVKGRIAESLAPLGVSFPVVVHPSVVRARHNTIGDGSIVGAGNVISVNVELGQLVTINHSCTLAHDVGIGDYSTVLPGSNVSGRVVIEPRVTVGTNSAIVQDLTIGEGTTIGAGATVLEDLPPNVTAVGTPARPI
jgi:sugar O-acyltransferase (sialic acid O-acetyltransferase NeuD family)